MSGDRRLSSYPAFSESGRLAKVFKPWRPIDRDFGCHPELIYSLSGRTLRVRLRQTFGPALEIEIEFADCIAGLLVIDESVYQSSLAFGLPKASDFEFGRFAPIPWPLWKEAATPRSALYGDLGRGSYKSMDSYYIVGADTVMLVDVADDEPSISIGGPNESPGRSRD
jgi:hypothetical protein